MSYEREKSICKNATQILVFLRTKGKSTCNNQMWHTGSESSWAAVRSAKALGGEETGQAFPTFTPAWH